MTDENSGESGIPTISFDGPRVRRILTGLALLFVIAWWFIAIASQVPDVGFRLFMMIPTGIGFVFVGWRYLQPKRLVLDNEGIHVPDATSIPWQDISDIQPSADGESLFVFLYSVPSLNGNRFAADPVWPEPISIPMLGWSSSPAAVIASVKTGFAAHLADRAAFHGDDSYAPDVSDSIDPAECDPDHVLRDLTVHRDARRIGGSTESFKTPTEAELLDLIHDLPNGSSLTLQHGRDTEYTLRLTSVGRGPRYDVDSRQGSGTEFRAGFQDAATAAEVALSWGRSEGEWRQLVRWDRRATVRRRRSG
jgi:hypothetical protein